MIKMIKSALSCALVLTMLTVLTPVFTSSANATEYVWKNCSSSEKSQIRAAVNWLKANMDKIDRKMGRNGLMSWPGKSRNKFVNKLDKKLKIRCRDADSKMCTPKEVGDNVFRTRRGRVIPILHQRRIDLCLKNIADSGKDEDEDAAYLASIIAHEIAHLVRLNAHRTKCVNKYSKPRFSQSVGLAVYHAVMGTTFRSSDYTSRCP